MNCMMAATKLGAPNVPLIDDLDDSLFDYDVDDAFRDVDTNMDVPAVRAKSKEDGAGLGIDEEIKMTKKRAPIPKLDENRILSPAGIPRLQRIAKERLRFKGKGYEYYDIARLLDLYQLWLDDLYPRAKFADGLAIIEKLGHTKRMQTMRREWINERKPLKTFDSLEESAENPVGERTRSKAVNGFSPIKMEESPRRSVADVEGDEHLYVATPKSARDNGKSIDNTENLFIEDSTRVSPISKQKADCQTREEIIEEGEEDDQDALLALNDIW